LKNGGSNGAGIIRKNTKLKIDASDRKTKRGRTEEGFPNDGQSHIARAITVRTGERVTAKGA